MISMPEYLKIPAVSASLLRTAIERCLYAAWFESWLNPNPPPPDDTNESDIGTTAHAILLEGSYKNIAVIDPQDHPAEKTGNIPDGWTNKSIRLARDVARLDGKTPILKPKMAEIEAMVGAAREYIGSLLQSEPAVWEAFEGSGGLSEQTHQWDDNGVPCKIRPDRQSMDCRLIVDYKSTAGSAHPDAWGRTQLIGAGYYLSAAFYRRGFEALFGTKPDYLFLAQEVHPPYLCSLVGLEPALLDLGERKIQAALTLWRECVRVNRWPAYATRVAYPETPGWLLAEYQDDYQAKELDDIWTKGLGSQP